MLRARIITALQELNKEWNFSSCNQLTLEDCEDLGIDINCNKRRSSGTSDASSTAQRFARELNLRTKRQVGGNRGEDQAYQLEISFPTVDNEEVTNEDGQRVKRISSIFFTALCLFIFFSISGTH